jgi:hypothetical protein
MNELLCRDLENGKRLHRSKAAKATAQARKEAGLLPGFMKRGAAK